MFARVAMRRYKKIRSRNDIVIKKRNRCSRNNNETRNKSKKTI